MTLTVGSLFSGIGGLDLGLERAGMEIRWNSEIDPYCCRVLAKHWPGIPNLGDVTAVDWSTVEKVDVVCGGFPCQPVSEAGRKRAQDDERWLWPVMRDAIGAVRPEWVVIENVPGLRRRGLNIVRADLHALDYRSRPIPISACELGAPHARRRLFTLAHAAGFGCRPGWPERRSARAPEGERLEGGTARPSVERGAWWADEPRVDRVAYGVPGRVDRVRALGNAVVPQVAQYIGERVMEMASCS